MPRLTSKLLILIGLLSIQPCIADSPIFPDPLKTPGDVLTTDPNVICVSGYTKTVRDVPQAVKQQAYQSYGIYRHQPGEFEVDHLISLELGGSNSIKNLWPESFVTHPLNAHVKDQLENKLHQLICSNQVPVAQAQQEIATNWVAAYEKYIGALPNNINPNQTKPKQAAIKNSGDCPKTAPIKVSKKGIYHLPGDASYDKTKAKQCFESPAAAEMAGFRAVRER